MFNIFKKYWRCTFTFVSDCKDYTGIMVVPQKTSEKAMKDVFAYISDSYDYIEEFHCSVRKAFSFEDEQEPFIRETNVFD